ncbi:hypothetical protein XELAEV_18040692mg, partial [Xenopus laevis]
CEFPAEGSVRSVVSFSPNWVPILYNDSVTLTCNLDTNPKKEKRYSWYRDNIRLSHYEKNYTIQAARPNDSGNYQCQADTTKKSDAVQLNFSVGPVILQAPPSVCEGDYLSLRCHSRYNDTEYSKFYKDGTVMESPGTGSIFQAGKAIKKMTGTYKCSKEYDQYSSTKFSNEEFIYVA